MCYAADNPFHVGFCGAVKRQNVKVCIHVSRNVYIRYRYQVRRWVSQVLPALAAGTRYCCRKLFLLSYGLTPSSPPRQSPRLCAGARKNQGPDVRMFPREWIAPLAYNTTFWIHTIVFVLMMRPEPSNITVFHPYTDTTQSLLPPSSVMPFAE